MKYTHISARTLVATLITFGLLAERANASVLVNITQVGGNVVASFNGTVDLTELTHQNLSEPVPAAFSYGIQPDAATFGIGGSSEFDPYGAATNAGPAFLGSGETLIAPDSSNGDFFGNGGSSFEYDVWVPSGYVSGTLISGSSTWIGQTIASLGLTSGSYNYTWANDSMTVNIAVPEPSSALPFGLAALGLIVARRRRSN